MDLKLRDNPRKERIEMYRTIFGVYRQVWHVFSYAQHGRGGAYTRETALERAEWLLENGDFDNIESAYKFARDSDRRFERKRYQFQVKFYRHFGQKYFLINIRRAPAGTKGSIFPYSRQIGIYREFKIGKKDEKKKLITN